MTPDPVVLSKVRREWAKPFMVVQFDLTGNHIELLREMWVDWGYAEFGAPRIDPKKPYGNSDVIRDIHTVFCGPTIAWDDEFGMPAGTTPDAWRELSERYTQLHRETEIALQVVLVTGGFEPGHYEAREYHHDWRRVHV